MISNQYNHFKKILHFDDTSYIEALYFILLKRPIDKQAKEQYLYLLETKAISKIQIAQELFYSIEGSKKNQITGIWKLNKYFYRHAARFEFLKKIHIYILNKVEKYWIKTYSPKIIENTITSSTFTKNQRILLCSNAYPPNFIGGAEIIAHQQALELKRQGYDVTVFAGDFHIDVPHYAMKKEHYDGIDVYRVKLTLEDFDGAKINFIHPQIEEHFIDILKELNPHIVHMHNIIGLSVRLAPLARHYGAKTVLTLHDGWGFCYKNTMMRNDGSFCSDFSRCEVCQASINSPTTSNIPMAMRQDYLKLCLMDVDIFISPSHYLREQYIQAGFDANKLKVLSNGINVEKFQKEKTKSKYIRFTFIGHLGSHKGIQLILEALASIEDKIEIQLNIVGEGALRESLEAYVQKHKLVDNVHFAGKVANNDIPEVFANTDVMILPSMWPENQPVSITEAFASHTPVIGTDFGGISELIAHKERGLLFPMGDIYKLAKCMTYFCKNPDSIHTYGKNAYEFIKTKDFKHQVTNLISLYHTPTAPNQYKPFVVSCSAAHIPQDIHDTIQAMQSAKKSIYCVMDEWLLDSVQEHDFTWEINKE